MDNCFLLLGKTGVGKSTLAKILSEDKTIKIGHSLFSMTEKSKCHICGGDDFKFSLIDNPGYDDSRGNDKGNFEYLKNNLISNNYKIKGIVLMFNFQDERFSESHIKGLIKIVTLIPLENFWEYVVIVFTHTYYSSNEELCQLKVQRLEDFQKIFDVFISAFYKTKKIKKIDSKFIKKIFLNLNEKKTKKNELNELISFFKANSKLEPLYHNIEVKYQSEEVMILDEKDENKGTVFLVKYKVFEYYNKNGTLIKKIAKPIEKEFQRTLVKTIFDGEIQKNCIKASSILEGLSGVFLGASGLIFFVSSSRNSIISSFSRFLF